MAVWPGRKTGAFNHIAILNETGTKPPLLWVFNSANEFPALADALGPDQPLIGMRSLNGVVRNNALTLVDSRAIAARLSSDLALLLGKGACFVGGNCQGAAIAAGVARSLLLGGTDVRGFVALEWSDAPALPLRTTLWFGAESADFNPFLRNLNPWPVWKRAFPAVECRVVCGAHGTYFRPETVFTLADEVRRALSLPPLSPDAGRAALDLHALPDRVAARGTVVVGARASVVRPGDDVLARWESDDCVAPHLQIVPIAHSSGSLRLDLSAPAHAGGWTLQLFLTNPQSGPVSWAADTLCSHRIMVEAPSASVTHAAESG